LRPLDCGILPKFRAETPHPAAGNRADIDSFARHRYQRRNEKSTVRFT
jgi:hypothetical protein